MVFNEVAFKLIINKTMPTCKMCRKDVQYYNIITLYDLINYTLLPFGKIDHDKISIYYNLSC